MWCFMRVMGFNYHYCVEPGKVCAKLTEGYPLSLHWPSHNCSSENTVCKGLESSEAITSKAHVAGRPLCSVPGLSTGMCDGVLPSPTHVSYGSFV